MSTLLIDDEPFALKILARQLTHLGCTPLTLCERAEEALAILESPEKSIDLVITDLQMPEMDGVEFVRHLARIGYRGGLVLVSGEDVRILQSVERLAQAHRINMLGVLQKPIATDALRLTLAKNTLRKVSRPRNADFTHTPMELDRAISAGELVLHYQPQVELVDGKLTGVEALVRWQHPRQGLIYPDQFIAMAEEYGLIDRLTRAVLTAAIGQARIWRDAGFELQMAVNVSMDNLAELDFPDVLEQLARQAGVPLSTLVLEVTESRLLLDARGPLDILARLRLKRIGLSIDDFGTGYSSLAKLRDIPFCELKLDRSFVEGAAHDTVLRAIVDATLVMTRHLDITSVAEGIENRDDWDCLRQLGCDLAQGYFIARPMPGDQLLTWLDQWNARRGELTATAVEQRSTA